MRLENKVLISAVVIGILLSLSLSSINPTGAFTYAASSLPSSIVSKEEYFGTLAVMLDKDENDILEVPWAEKTVNSAAIFIKKKLPNSTAISKEDRDKLANALYETIKAEEPKSLRKMSALTNLGRAALPGGSKQIAIAWKFYIKSEGANKKVTVHNDWYYKNQRAALADSAGTVRADYVDITWVKYSGHISSFTFDPTTGQISGE